MRSLPVRVIIEDLRRHRNSNFLLPEPCSTTFLAFFVSLFHGVSTSKPNALPTVARWSIVSVP